MKYIISVFFSLFAFLCISFKVECLNTVTGYDDDNKPSWVYYDASDILNQTYGSYDTNTFPYFIEFSLIRSDITPGDRNYIEIFRLAFREEITFTFTNGFYQFYIPNSTFYFCGVQFYNSNTWERSYNPSIINQHNFPYGVFSSAYVSAGNIPFTFNGNTVEPPPDVQGDTFFVTKEGFTNNFGVFCGPASDYVDNGEQLPLNYYRTKVYTVHIKFQYQGSTVDYIVPNYLNWLYKYNTYVKTQDVSNVLEYLPAYTFYAQPVYNTSMQAIRCPVINEPTLFTTPPLAILSAPITTLSILPCDIKNPEATSGINLTGMFSCCISHTLKLAPCPLGRVSSHITLIFFPASLAALNTPKAVP